MLPALIDNVEMHGVAAHFAEPADSRLARAHGADRFAMALGAAQFDDRTETFDRTRNEIERGFVPGDQFAALVIVGVRQQCRDRDLREFRIAIKFLAVGEGELGAFDLQMDEFGAGGSSPSSSNPFSSASCCSMTGPWLQTPGLQTV